MDLILMDIDLGDNKMDGTETAKLILEKYDLPIIFFTSHTEKEYVDRVKQITGYGYVLKSSGEYVLMESINTAFKLFKMIKTSDAAADILSGAPADFTGKNFGEILNPELAQQQIDRINRTINTCESLSFEGDNLTINGKSYWLSTTYNCILNEEGELLGVETISNDITNLKKKEEELRQKNTYLSYLIDNVPVILYSFVPGKGGVRYSPQLKKILGIDKTSMDENPMLWHDSIHPEDIAKVDDTIAKSIRGDSIDVIYRIHDAEGNWHWFHDMANSRKNEDGSVILDGVAFDITKQKKMYDSLKNALDEKNFLMQELNHRVKNNLAMISALIQLKNTSLGGSVDLSDLSRQIDAFSIIYDKLFQTGLLSSIDIHDYITELLQSIFTTLTAKTINLESSLEHCSISSKTAISVGLIINEIATNAIKHGFGLESNNTFRIDFRRYPDSGNCCLVLSNNGREFPDSVRLDNPDTLGLRLINTLVGQLEGTITLNRKPHPVFTITFPCPAE